MDAIAGDGLFHFDILTASSHTIIQQLRTAGVYVGFPIVDRIHRLCMKGPGEGIPVTDKAGVHRTIVVVAGEPVGAREGAVVWVVVAVAHLRGVVDQVVQA